MPGIVKQTCTDQPYTELQVTTNYSFLRGASHVEELIARAAMLGMKALAVTDRNSLRESCGRISGRGRPGCV
jgi:DNA polymerase III alpha subunit (gram-positive type)